MLSALTIERANPMKMIDQGEKSEAPKVIEPGKQKPRVNYPSLRLVDLGLEGCKTGDEYEITIKARAKSVKVGEEYDGPSGKPDKRVHYSFDVISAAANHSDNKKKDYSKMSNSEVDKAADQAITEAAKN